MKASTRALYARGPPAPSPTLDWVRGGFGDGSGIGLAPGEGTVGVARDGGGISVTGESGRVLFGCTACTKSASLAEWGLLTVLGGLPGNVAGERASAASTALGVGRFAAATRMLGGGGRMLGPALGGEGRMLGGGGRERPRTGGGGGVAEGRESGALVNGRGGSETGRSGWVSGRGGSTEDAPVDDAAGVPADAEAAPAVPADAEAAPAVPARLSLSLAVFCSSPIAART